MSEIAAPYVAEFADHLQKYAAARGITLLRPLFYAPTLTSISPDKAAIASLAVDGLLAALRGEPLRADEVECTYELQVRKSSQI